MQQQSSISIHLAAFVSCDPRVLEEDWRHSLSDPLCPQAVCSKSDLSRRVDEVMEEVKEACLPLSDPLRDLSCNTVLRSDVKEEVVETRVKVEVEAEVLEDQPSSHRMQVRPRYREGLEGG